MWDKGGVLLIIILPIGSLIGIIWSVISFLIYLVKRRLREKAITKFAISLRIAILIFSVLLFLYYWWIKEHFVIPLYW